MNSLFLICPSLCFSQSSACRVIRSGVWDPWCDPVDPGCKSPDRLPGCSEHLPVHVLLHSPETPQHHQHLGGCRGGRHPTCNGLDSSHRLSRSRYKLLLQAHTSEYSSCWNDWLNLFTPVQIIHLKMKVFAHPHVFLNLYSFCFSPVEHKIRCFYERSCSSFSIHLCCIQ